MDPTQTTTPPSYNPHSRTQFEDPTVEGQNVPPGYWANEARRCEWPRGRRQARTPGTLLNELQQLPLQREPTVKNRLRRGVNQCHNGANFWNLLGQKKANIEAINAQVTGVLLDSDSVCGTCAREDGIFDGCVQVPGQRQCANCHFGGRAQRCSSHVTSSNDTQLSQALAWKEALRQRRVLMEQEMALMEQQLAVNDQQMARVEVQILELQGQGSSTVPD